MARPNGYVYFVQAGMDGLIKIGLTLYDPVMRLRTLAAGSPVHLRCLGVMRGNPEIEKGLHGRFLIYRRHYEWFYPGPELLDFIEKNARRSARFDAAIYPHPSAAIVKAREADAVKCPRMGRTVVYPEDWMEPASTA